MCGIAGMVGARPDEAWVARVADALGHRGPDGRGAFSSSTCAIAHTRLSIIDLAQGAQPMTSPDGITIAVNGEIYNYSELKAAFREDAFQTRSDSEILIHLYRRHGIEGVTRMRGMFAFVLVDARDPGAERVYLGRDPFGIKPLYTRALPDGFAFASEPGALAFDGPPVADRHACDEFLALQFTTGTRTPFVGIERVAPGRVLEVTGGRPHQVLRLQALPVDTRRHRFEGLSALDAVLEDTVHVHQRSDVPYGLFLSGGVDSTVVMAMMARLNDRPLVAITSGFPNSGVADERDAAAATARHFGAIHHEVTIDEGEFWTLLPNVVAALDDPVGDFATLPTYKMAALARSLDLKVILCGEGGDELFAGYGRYRRARHRLTWRGGGGYRRRPKIDFPDLWRRDDRTWRAGIERDLIEARSHPALSSLQQAQYADVIGWLPNDLLTKLDRCLMVHGVEGRTPFVDPKVAQFAFPLADRDKIRRGQGKYPLKAWLAEHVPHVRPFAKKRFFSVPVGEWIQGRGSALGSQVARTPAVAEIAYPERVEALFGTPGKRAGFAAWLLLYYALWYRLHVERIAFDPGMSVDEILAM